MREGYRLPLVSAGIVYLGGIVGCLRAPLGALALGGRRCTGSRRRRRARLGLRAGLGFGSFVRDATGALFGITPPLGFVEHDLAFTQPGQRFATLDLQRINAGGDEEALGAVRLTLAEARLDVGPLALDLLSLRRPGLRWLGHRPRCSAQAKPDGTGDERAAAHVSEVSTVRRVNAR